MHEVKFDGYRIVTRVEDHRAKLISRNGLDWTEKFSSIAESVADLDFNNAILDGEVVILNREGVSDFGALQEYADTHRGTLTYYVFDLLYLDGKDLTGLPLLERKQILSELVQASPNIIYSDHIIGSGPQMFKSACENGLEGIISKRSASVYRQSRTRDWLKIKCIQRQEFVIGGYTSPAGSRASFGALAVGYYDETGQLIYCGRVGTGFNEKSLESVFARLKVISTPHSPFKNPPTGLEAKGLHSVQPTLVCEVEFAAWTKDRRLRHPVFKGLREDKPANQTRKETPMMSKPDSPLNVSITHPERVVYPDAKITKLELAQFMAEIAPWLLPHVENRPLALVRCPQGEGGECFFQKNFSESLPDSLFAIDIGDGDEGIGLKTEKALVELIQFGVMEIHPWGSTVKNVDLPDRITFDLDPGPGLGWDKVVQGALDVKGILDGIGLESWIKTSGGKGLHICIPIKPELGWNEIKNFSQGVANLMVDQKPDRYISVMSKAKRDKKIFVDYLRNGRGSTSVAAYSPRSRPGAPVSMPIEWDDISDLKSADQFTLKNSVEHIKSRKKDPWADFLKSKQSLAKVLK